MKDPDPSLQDVIRWAEAFPLMLKACKKLDELNLLSSSYGFSQEDYDVVEAAFALSHQALKKLKGE